MSKQKMLIIVTLLILSPVVCSHSFIKVVKAPFLSLELHLDKDAYNIGENVTLRGTLNLDGTPVTDAIVSIQINDPNGELWLIRSLPTGVDTATKKWSLEVTNVTPSSLLLNRGDMLGLRITIRNNDLIDRQTLIVVSLIHESGIPLAVEVIANITIEANKTQTCWFSNVAQIPNDAPNGVAVVFVNLVTALPSDGGWAWGLEGRAIIFIGSTSKQYIMQQTEGNVTLNVKTKNINAMLGNYTVYASTLYVKYPITLRARSSTTFTVILLGDITGPFGIPDGKVDIRDVSLVAYSFGSFPGHPRWNPIADLYKDDKINIRDVTIVAANYGKRGILP